MTGPLPALGEEFGHWLGGSERIFQDGDDGEGDEGRTFFSGLPNKFIPPKVHVLKRA